MTPEMEAAYITGTGSPNWKLPPGHRQGLAAVLAIAERERAELPAEVAEVRALFDLQWTRSRQADAMWQAEDPENRANTWPDLGALLTWLMAKIRTLEGERDQVAPLRAVLDKLIDPHACHYDHHGDCQEHGTTSARPCPHARAKDLLGWMAP